MTIKKRYINKYNSSSIAIEVDKDKKHVILYHGLAVPISGEWKKTTIKEVWETYDAYSENPLYTVEDQF